MLHTVDRARAESVITACTAGGERERAPGAELSGLFDPTLPPARRPSPAEAAAIAAARGRLEHPDKEIVPGELARTYLPVTVQLDIHHAPPRSGAHAAAVAAAPLEGPPVVVAAAPAPVDVPAFAAPALAAPPAPRRVALIGEATPANPTTVVIAAPAQPQAYAPAVTPAGAAAPVPQDEADILAGQLLAVRDPDQDIAADEAELAQKDHNAAVVAGLAAPPLPAGASDAPPTSMVPGAGPATSRRTSPCSTRPWAWSA